MVNVLFRAAGRHARFLLQMARWTLRKADSVQSAPASPRTGSLLPAHGPTYSWSARARSSY